MLWHQELEPQAHFLHVSKCVFKQALFFVPQTPDVQDQVFYMVTRSSTLEEINLEASGLKMWVYSRTSPIQVSDANPEKKTIKLFQTFYNLGYHLHYDTWSSLFFVVNIIHWPTFMSFQSCCRDFAVKMSSALRENSFSAIHIINLSVNALEDKGDNYILSFVTSGLCTHWVILYRYYTETVFRFCCVHVLRCDCS